jgi:predicted acetyltransferase
MEFRTITPEEVDPFFASLSVAFADARPDPDEVQSDKEVIEPDRSFAAIDDGRIVGCASAISQRMIVPGGAAVPTAGITMVGVLPTHRRRGILRRLMGLVLDQAAERGEPLATLFASQAAIYGRFGFGHAAQHLSYDIALDRVAWASGTEATGRVRLLPRDDALPLMRRIYDTAIVGRAGAVELDDRWLRVGFWESSKDDERQFYAIHEDDEGVPDALAMYGVKHEWPRGLPHLEMKVRRFIATTAAANASMWRYLFDVDLVSRVRAETRPVDDPLLWQLEEPRALRPELDDGLFLRPVELASALEARAYAGDGRVVLGVTDATLPNNDGTFELDVSGGTASCRATADAPDIVGPVHAIGAVYLGGATWTTLAAAGRVEERTPGTLRLADAMCRTDRAPWPVLYF